MKDFTWEDQKKMNAFVESTKETDMSIMEKIKQNAVDLWNDHKAEILIGAIWGSIGIYSVVAMALGFKRQKAFNQEVKANEGFKNPDDEHIAVAVFQQCGQMFHSDWI